MLPKRSNITEENLPAILGRVIASQPKGFAILQQAGASRERVTDVLQRIQFTLYVPFEDDFDIPTGMTRKTFQGLIKRMDELAGDIAKLHDDDVYTPVYLCGFVSDEGKKQIGSKPLEKCFSALPALLRIYANSLKAAKKTTGRIRMGPGRGHLARNYFLGRLLAEIKQRLRASDYRSIGGLLDALVPENQAPVPAFEESRLRKLHKNTLKRAIQKAS